MRRRVYIVLICALFFLSSWSIAEVHGYNLSERYSHDLTGSCGSGSIFARDVAITTAELDIHKDALEELILDRSEYSIYLHVNVHRSDAVLSTYYPELSAHSFGSSVVHSESPTYYSNFPFYFLRLPIYQHGSPFHYFQPLIYHPEPPICPDEVFVSLEKNFYGKLMSNSPKDESFKVVPIKLKVSGGLNGELEIMVVIENENYGSSEPGESEDPTEPTEPEGPVGPTEPTEPEEPVGPTEPAEPEEPVGPTEPVEPTEPTEPEEPVGPTEPVEPIDPAEPERPVGPTEPVEPVEPGGTEGPTVQVEPKPLDRDDRNDFGNADVSSRESFSDQGLSFSEGITGLSDFEETEVVNKQAEAEPEREPAPAEPVLTSKIEDLQILSQGGSPSVGEGVYSPEGVVLVSLAGVAGLGFTLSIASDLRVIRWFKGKRR